jgi:hypothetical protein
MCVMGWWVVFGEIICMVGGSTGPFDCQLALFYAVLYPIEPHIHGFQSFDFGPLVSKPICCGVVRSDLGRSRLGPTQFLENLAIVDSLLARVEEGCNFRFRCCCHDVFENSALNMNGTVGGRVIGRLCAIPQVEVASHPGSCLGFA